MELRSKTIAASLSPAVKSVRPGRDDFEKFKKSLHRYLSLIDEKESEENHKTHLIDVLKAVFPGDNVIEQQGKIDCVIRTGGKHSPAAVLIETKTQSNRAEMISATDINRKALHEAVLYYSQERGRGNISIKKVVICSTFEFYIFDASQIERAFYRNTRFRKQFEEWEAGRLTENTTEFFYRSVVSPYILAETTVLEATYFDLRENIRHERSLLATFKALSPQNLIGQGISNDSNHLNKTFYDELLYLIGLEEVKSGTKRVIRRRAEERRSTGSLIELALAKLENSDGIDDADLILRYGASRESRAYAVALELCLTWVNRLLFLKLLEAQLIRYHQGSAEFEFLNETKVADFGELSNLFFLVLALEPMQRPAMVRRYEKIPYLNSSLFEKTAYERILDVGSLGNQEKLQPFRQTVLRSLNGKKLDQPIRTLPYLFKFFDAYNFGSETGGEIRENSKTLISASVLGLIFEKINGYQDGAIFTPGLITMHMSRTVIEAAVIKSYNKEFPGANVKTVLDIRNSIIDRSAGAIRKLNELVDCLKICDPAVGSGHFLVSCLNELVALKSRIGILADAGGARIIDYVVEVENDELIVAKADTDELFSYIVSENNVSAPVQHVQQTIFEEKRKLIENCLFGVDINSNSVRICQLRLWIELLKSAYYRDSGRGPLETLPNIDINIKVGDSLLSRFSLDQNLSSAFKSAGLTVREYRDLVERYKETREKTAKRDLETKLGAVKQRFQQEALGNITRSINAEIAQLRAQEAQLGLFQLQGESEDVRQQKLDKARATISRLEERRENELRRKTYLGALEWRFEFPEILSPRGAFEGFDIIIGNPPYGVSVTGNRRDAISKVIGKVPDFEIYYMFLNQGRRLLKKDGMISFIIPNSILFNVYAKSYRMNLLGDWSELQIDDLTEYTVFSDAVVHNIILTGRKSGEHIGVRFRRTGKEASIQGYLAQEQLHASMEQLSQGNRNWGLIFRLAPEVVKTVLAIKSNALPLSDLFKDNSQGLIAYDKYRGQDELTIKKRVYHKQGSSEHTSPWINGEDVRRFSMKWNGVEYIEYGAHLANPRKPKYFTEPRVLVREITNPRIYAAYTKIVAYNDPAVINILASNDKRFTLQALAGILNSHLATFYHFNTSPKASKGSFPKILVDDIREFPLPDPDDAESILAEIHNIAVQIAELLVTDPAGAEITVAEASLNSAVYRAYSLDAAAVATIEGAFSTAAQAPTEAVAAER